MVVVSVFVDLRGERRAELREQAAMAMGGRMGAVLLVVLAFLLVQCVVRTEAGYDSSMAEFTSPSGLSQEDLSAWEDPEDEFLDEPTRRLLAVRRRSYISYGALNGNRAPCPSRSGRSYYTPNCANQNGRAQPYRRGCYQITRCARG